MNIEVKQIEPKVWGLYVGGSLLGTSKNRFDADHGKVILENALGRIQLDAPKQNDPTIFPGVYDGDHS